MKYKPVNCGFYDHFEAAITLNKKTPIVYYGDGANNQIIHKQVHAKDLLQENGEEFLLLEDGTKIRLDRILSFNEIENPDSGCSF